ncbi:MAG: VOC family protein [Rhizobiales bacterium]|nr:VOC family protein [Hyphomicrobiales bacterium]MBN8986327.1 VOC family protein [Hyphomicrobiales bacterium]
MATSVRPFLMFEGRANEAIAFYVGLIPNSDIVDVTRYGAGEPGPEGTVKFAVVRLAGQQVLFSDSFVSHGFTFTPSLSLFVDCESEADLEHIFTALSEGGGVLMPLGNYGFSRRFGWVNDRFGVSWQLNLP